MIHQRLVLPIFLATALLAGDTARAGAQTAADLFDVGTLHEIRLFISSRDLQQLRARYRENTYYTADLLWRNVRVRNVGIRSRGSTGRSPTKPALRIDFNRFTTGQRFLGLKSLLLDNLFQDPGMIRERVAMAFFERLGQPASRESFCRLYINNVYHGVYAIVESVDTDYLSRTVGENGGYLFEYNWLRPYYGDYPGDDLPEYKRLFTAQTHELEADTILYSPIRDLFREVNGPDDAVWRDRVEQYIDVRQFVTQAAIEIFLSEEDGILGGNGMNNFYLYRYAGTNRHRLLPWDKDKVFEKIDTPIFQHVDEYVVFRRLMEFDDLRRLYLDALEQCARAAAEEDWLEREILRSASLIDQAGREDALKPFTNDEYDLAIAFFVKFAKLRPAFVLQEVAKARTSSSR